MLNWLYVVGGGINWDPLVGGQVYDPATNTWSYMTDAFSDYHRAGNGLAYVAGRLLLAGGTSKVYDLNSNKVEAYRLRDDFCNSAVHTDQAGDSARHAHRLHDRAAQRHHRRWILHK